MKYELKTHSIHLLFSTLPTHKLHHLLNFEGKTMKKTFNHLLFWCVYFLHPSKELLKHFKKNMFFFSRSSTSSLVVTRWAHFRAEVYKLDSFVKFPLQNGQMSIFTPTFGELSILHIPLDDNQNNLVKDLVKDHIPNRFW